MSLCTVICNEKFVCATNIVFRSVLYDFLALWYRVRVVHLVLKVVRDHLAHQAMMVHLEMEEQVEHK